jgi:alcohol dehydrogenase class IV
LCSKVDQLLKDLDLPTNLNGLGIDKESFEDNLEELAQNSLKDPTSFTSPIPLDIEIYKEIFRHAYEGKELPLDLQYKWEV